MRTISACAPSSAGSSDRLRMTALGRPFLSPYWRSISGANRSIGRRAQAIAIVDVARRDVGRIVTAAVIVGIVIGEIARRCRQVEPRAAATVLDLNHIVPAAFAGLLKDQPGRCGTWVNASQTDNQQAGRHHRGEQLPMTHEITSIVTIRKAILAAASVQ